MEISEPMSCIQQVKEWIENNKLLLNRTGVIAAVSGGPDSMALLSIMDKLSRYFGYQLAAAFFHHGIRPETDREKELVEKTASRLGVRLITGGAPVPREAENQKMGLEETARKLRYRFFRDILRDSGSDTIALGHTADDQIETILHNIIRGTGLRGLAGMPSRRGPFIRPLLSCRRSQLIRHLEEEKIDYAIDRSNLDTSYMRNRIRNVLIPYLKDKFNPSIRNSILRLGENISGALESLQDTMEKIHIREERDGSVSIPIKEISSWDGFRVYLLVDNLLRERFDIYQDFNKSHFDSIKKLIREGHSGRELHLPHGIRLFREQQNIIVTRNRKTFQQTGREDEASLPGSGKYSLPERQIRVSIEKIHINGNYGLNSGPDEGWFGDIEFPLKVRKRKPGDKLVPLGMRGRKRLSDIFIDRKIPLRQRDRIPVFEDAGGIIWVPGVVTAERSRVTSETGEATVIKISQMTTDNEIGNDGE